MTNRLPIELESSKHGYNEISNKTKTNIEEKTENMSQQLLQNTNFNNHDRTTLSSPRRYNFHTKTFSFDKTIHLSDTNTFGSVYFAKFFEFQGCAREEFLKYFMGQDFKYFLDCNFGIHTVNASCKYKKQLMVFDEISVQLQVTHIKRAKFRLSFQTKNNATGECVATGEQWIGFTSKQGKPIPIPNIVLNNLKNFAI